ncbi:DUF6668 family protein [Cellulosimicrobium cellulans]|uniref:DUF6668 family protein n=1 Tax=Cellulosimicrobium cellulans TaxID=1710 RepID=UPI001D16F8C8|nr:DUF6668 family protein [Cellulosimicrobium cellulans]
MTDGSSNPWLTRPAEPQPVVPRSEVTEPAVPVATGPTAPQRGVPAPGASDRLPIQPQPRDADVWWLGVHGGAGETSLAALVPDWLAAEHAWPQTLGGARVVLTARSNMRGLRAAQAAATQWAAGLVPHVEVVGLVIVADAPGRLPRPLREFSQIVGGGVPRTWTLPWIEAWRLGEPPALSDAPREVRRLVDDLRAVVRPGAAGTVNRKETR